MQNNIIPCDRTVMLFPAAYADKDALYGALIRLLDLPEWCGHNADALHDVLGETDPIRLILSGAVPEAIAADVERITMVVTDLDGEVIAE